MPKPNSRATALTEAQLMTIGEAVDGGMKPGQAVVHFGFSKGAIYRALRHYEKVTGKKLVGPSVAEKSRMKKAGVKPRDYAKEYDRRKNGTTALATVEAAGNWQARAIEAEKRSFDLAEQLEHATDEAHTLQKIIITLGRAL